MQTASSNFALAVSASSGVWAPTQVRTDWDGAGYSGDTSIDNLSDLAGRPIVVSQVLDDGMPSDVSLSVGKDATSSASMPVGGRTVSGVPFSGPQYWSLDNTSSPLSGYDRDTAALTVAHGPVTAAGIERVTVFTGRMADVAVTGRSATLQAVSSTRLKMTKAVQPPGIWGDSAGLNATWPVVFALYQCGIYVSPPPRSGCRWWSPMHGSIKSMLPVNPTRIVRAEFLSYYRLDAGASGSIATRPTFVTDNAPYVMGCYAQLQTSQSRSIKVTDINLEPGSDLISQAGNAGRVEFWVRGDAADTSTGPDIILFGSISKLAGFEFDNVNGTYVAAGVGTDRKVYVSVYDGAHTSTLKSSSAVPTDGAWYFVGAAWNVATNKLWVDFNGTVASSTPSPAMSTSGLPAADDWYTTISNFLSYLPVTEVHLTAGTQANPDNYVWVNDGTYAWTAGAVLRPSRLDLVGLAEPKPREAWELISQFAQAELAMTRTDELDRFCYLPLSYWVETAQQTVADTWSTSLNADGDFSITRDPTKVRNEVTVTYSASTIAALTSDIVYIGLTVITIPPGISTQTFPVAGIAWAAIATLTNLNATDVQTIGGNVPYGLDFVCINSRSDGAGSYATTAQVSARVTAWTSDSVEVTFTNYTYSNWYVANGSTVGVPFIQLYGSFLAKSTVSVTVRDEVSVAARGVRGLTVDLPGIQDATTAAWAAETILTFVRVPRPVLKARLRADPRRQPGDLVTFTDPTNTGVSGQWRVMSVDTTINGADATQQVVATKAWPVAVWGQSNWGEALWGP